MNEDDFHAAAALTENNATDAPTSSDVFDSLRYSDLTDAQNIIMGVLMIPSGILSILGSSTILYSIWRRNIKKEKPASCQSNGTTNCQTNFRSKRKANNSTTKPLGPYERILMALSIMDIIFTITVVAQTVLIPRDTTHRITSFGNAATCTMMGFFWQFTLSNFYFSGLLNYYYLRTIVSGWSEARFAKHEPYWMAAGLLWYTGTAILGVVMDWYDANELGVGCWVNNVPRGCGEDPWDSQEPCISVYIAWLFGGFQIVFLFVFVAISNAMIFCHVRKTMAKAQQWTLRTMGRYGQQQQQQAQIQQEALQQEQPKSWWQRWRQQRRVNNDNSTTTSATDARVQQVATQCALYVAAFWISAAPTIVLRNLEGFNFGASDEGLLYPLLLIQSVLTPLVGFLNMLVVSVVYIVLLLNLFCWVEYENEDDEKVFCLLKKVFFV